MLWVCLYSCASAIAQSDNRAPSSFTFPTSQKWSGVGSVNAETKCTPGVQAHKGSGSSPSCPGLLTYQLAHAMLLSDTVCTLVVDAHLTSLTAQSVLSVCPCEIHRKGWIRQKSIVSIHVNKWPERTNWVSCSRANTYSTLCLTYFYKCIFIHPFSLQPLHFRHLFPRLFPTLLLPLDIYWIMLCCMTIWPTVPHEHQAKPLWKVLAWLCTAEGATEGAPRL